MFITLFVFESILPPVNVCDAVCRKQRAADDLLKVVSSDGGSLGRALRAVELAPVLARRRPPAPRLLALTQLLQLDTLTVLAALSLLLVAAAAAFTTLLLTLLCYRKKVRARPKMA